MRASLFVTLALLMTATVATAQHQHTVAGVTEIDGRDHPELIPEIVAYQNFFRLHSISVGASDEDRKPVEYKIRRLGLDAGDELQLRLELVNYRTKFDQFNRDYTKQAERGLVGPDVFWAGVKRIVTETRGNLGKKLGVAGQAQFEEGVLQLRKNTRYFTTGGDL